MGVGLIIVAVKRGAGWVGVMEGNGLCPIHLHLVQKQIVFVPLYFSIDHYLFFVSVPLPNGPLACGTVRLQLVSSRTRAQWLCNGGCDWEEWFLYIQPEDVKAQRS